MDRTKRLRRMGILCCHFARNYAYYKAGWENNNLKIKNQFWVSLNSNFIDMSILEWYKLFGDYKDKRHWKNVMHHDQTFEARMLESLNIKQTELDRMHGCIKSYRDKFVAHLDSEETMNIPELEAALRMVSFYYSEVKKICDSTADWPKNIEDFYEEHFNKAITQHAQQI